MNWNRVVSKNNHSNPLQAYKHLIFSLVPISSLKRKVTQTWFIEELWGFYSFSLDIFPVWLLHWVQMSRNGKYGFSSETSTAVKLLSFVNKSRTRMLGMEEHSGSQPSYIHQGSESQQSGHSCEKGCTRIFQYFLMKSVPWLCGWSPVFTCKVSRAKTSPQSVGAPVLYIVVVQCGVVRL